MSDCEDDRREETIESEDDFPKQDEMLAWEVEEEDSVEKHTRALAEDRDDRES